MRVTKSPQRLVLEDSPGCFWLFGLFFVVLGRLGAYAALNDTGDRPGWQIGLALLLTLAAMAAGVWMIARSPGSRVVLDRRTRSMEITRRGMAGRSQEWYSWYEIDEPERIVTGDIDGDPVFPLAVRLRDGRIVRVTRLWLHDPEGLARNVAEMEQFLAD